MSSERWLHQASGVEMSGWGVSLTGIFLIFFKSLWLRPEFLPLISGWLIPYLTYSLTSSCNSSSNR